MATLPALGRFEVLNPGRGCGPGCGDALETGDLDDLAGRGDVEVRDVDAQIGGESQLLGARRGELGRSARGGGGT